MSRVKVMNSDGGKIAEGFAHETNDCTVRALANSTGLSYKESHRLAALAGRRPNSGMNESKLDKMMAELVKGGNYEAIKQLVSQATVIPGVRFLGRSLPRTKRMGGIIVSEFLWRLPKTGSFYCACSTHAFAVVDGVLRDARMMGRGKMCLCYEIKAKYPVAAPAPAPKVVPPQTGVLSTWHNGQYTPVARLQEMEEMKRKIARLEEMAAMKKRIAELEKQLGTKKALGTAAGQ